MRRLLPAAAALLAAAGCGAGNDPVSQSSAPAGPGDASLPGTDSAALPRNETRAPAADRAGERETMVLTIASMAASAGVAEARTLDPAVLDALRRVPRHLFVPAAERADAYRPTPLPIGHEQTISQPYIVAVMTHLLQVRPTHRVLEIGTGSGYQAAILSLLAGEVRTIEIVPALAREAATRLRTLGYGNVVVREGNGHDGWPEAAPFDRIMVTAGARRIPPRLLAQLAPGGRMVIPLGPSGAEEMLTVVEKDARGRVRSRALLPVRFVPLVEDAPSDQRR